MNTTGKIIGIIGYGGWGRAIENTFHDLGYEVICADKELAPGLVSKEEVMQKADVVIFCVDIWETIPLIKNLMPLAHGGQLLMDITSVKTWTMHEMSRHNIHAIGLHPQGQPGNKGWKNLNVAVCCNACDEYLPWVLDVLEKSGAHPEVCTSWQHDRLTSNFQCVIHAVLMAVVLLFKRVGIGKDSYAGFSTSLFRVFWCLAGRVLAKNAGLYSGIMMNNPYAVSALRLLEKNFRSLRVLVEKRDVEGFNVVFKEALDYYSSVDDVKKESALVTRYINLMDDSSSKNSVCITLAENRMGIFAEITRIFYVCRVDLSSISSDPVGDSFCFFANFSCDKRDERVQKALSQIAKIKGVLVN